MSLRTRDLARYAAGVWPLSSHALDVSRKGNDGTWAGTEQYTDFLKSSRSAADFNQASHIDCGAEIVGAGAATVMAWINLDDFGENTLGRICDNGNFDLYVNDTADTLDFTSDGGGTVLQSAAAAIVVASWIHVAVSRTAAGAAIIYVNGVWSAAGASGTPAAGTGNFTIGDDAADANAFDGRIADVRLYSFVASLDEVLSVAHEPVGIF